MSENIGKSGIALIWIDLRVEFVLFFLKNLKVIPEWILK